jgi:hypothetical protein
MREQFHLLPIEGDDANLILAYATLEEHLGHLMNKSGLHIVVHKVAYSGVSSWHEVCVDKDGFAADGGTFSQTKKFTSATNLSVMSCSSQHPSE